MKRARVAEEATDGENMVGSVLKSVQELPTDAPLPDELAVRLVELAKTPMHNREAVDAIHSVVLTRPTSLAAFATTAHLESLVAAFLAMGLSGSALQRFWDLLFKDLQFLGCTPALVAVCSTPDVADTLVSMLERATGDDRFVVVEVISTLLLVGSMDLEWQLVGCGLFRRLIPMVTEDARVVECLKMLMAGSRGRTLERMFVFLRGHKALMAVVVRAAAAKDLSLPLLPSLQLLNRLRNVHVMEKQYPSVSNDVLTSYLESRDFADALDVLTATGMGKASEVADVSSDLMKRLIEEVQERKSHTLCKEGHPDRICWAGLL